MCEIYNEYSKCNGGSDPANVESQSNIVVET